MPSLKFCDSVSSPHCTGNLGSEAPEGMRTCYRCGLDVCTECSSLQRARVVSRRAGARRLMTVRVIRLCDRCLGDEPDGEARVLLRRYHEAGYPQTTLADCQAEVAQQEVLREQLRVMRTAAADTGLRTAARPVARPARRRRLP